MSIKDSLMMMAIAVAWLPFSSYAQGQSLFERCEACRVNPFTNNVARSRGDLLVVLINESTDVENIDERTLERSGTSTLNGGVNYGLTGNLGTQIGTSTLGQTGNQSRAFNGDSEFRSARQLQDRFTVSVVDVLPNGNLLVEGHRKILLQGDVRTLQLSGVVRNLDLLPNNTVNSQLVGNLNIRLLADGQEDEFGRQGWLGRKLNKVLPF